MINSYYGNNSRTLSFSEIFDTADLFLAGWLDCPLYNSVISNDRIKELWYHLYAAYGNSHIASFDTNQFKAKVWSLVATKGLIWNTRLNILNKMVSLTDDEIVQNSKSWVNMAQNPMDIEDGRNGDDKDFLDFIQNQNVSFSERGQVDAYTNYAAALGVGISQTQEFVKQFKKLFKTVVDYEAPLYYDTEVED